MPSALPARASRSYIWSSLPSGKIKRNETRAIHAEGVGRHRRVVDDAFRPGIGLGDHFQGSGTPSSRGGRLSSFCLLA